MIVEEGVVLVSCVILTICLCSFFPSIVNASFHRRGRGRVGDGSGNRQKEIVCGGNIAAEAEGARGECFAYPGRADGSGNRQREIVRGGNIAAKGARGECLLILVGRGRGMMCHRRLADT